MSTVDIPFTRYFRVNRLSPGRAALVARQILRIAREIDEPTLIELAARLHDAADRYGLVSHGRRSQSGRRGDGSAYKIDKKIDRNIKGYAEQLDTVIADYGEDHELGATAISLRDETVPQGHYAVTGLPYEDEAQAVTRIIDRLRRVDRAVLVEMNVAYYLDRLEALLPAYIEALEVRRIVTAGDVKTARDAMHRALCGVVGHVCARFWRSDDLETRDRLLAPVDDQQDRISALARARRTGGRVAAEVADAQAAEDAALDALLEDELAFDEGVEGEDPMETQGPAEGSDPAVDAAAEAPRAEGTDPAVGGGAPGAEGPELRPLPGGGEG